MKRMGMAGLLAAFAVVQVAYTLNAQNAKPPGPLRLEKVKATWP